ncbi:MAG: hypothetical protein LBT00_09865 [Spirochaetaceae bacterium]|nr:hypothetical protein [Spirochaetaceae bacterium]
MLLRVGEAIQGERPSSGLLRRFASRNDGSATSHANQHERPPSLRVGYNP